MSDQTDVVACQTKTCSNPRCADGRVNVAREKLLHTVEAGAPEEMILEAAKAYREAVETRRALVSKQREALPGVYIVTFSRGVGNGRAATLHADDVTGLTGPELRLLAEELRRTAVELDNANGVLCRYCHEAYPPAAVPERCTKCGGGMQ